MLYVLIHGAFGSPESNWFPDLKERLEGLGQEVIAPAFPVDNWDEVTSQGCKAKSQNQTLSNWFEAFETYLPQVKKADKICFVGHSLGPLFTLHVATKYNLKLDSAIFVSPFLSKLSKFWQIDVVNRDFYKTDFDFKTLKKQIPVSYVLYSDDDPYVDKKKSIQFAKKLDSSLIMVKKAAHMNREVNLNEFPLVSELCKSRIDLTLYQRFLEQRRELFAVDYHKGKTEEMIYLDPDEVQYEGIFHFRNLRKEGFATFYTGTTFWDSQSKYMIEARKASKRVKHFKRVFVVDDPADLMRHAVKEQIRLDFEAGIEVYLCHKTDVLLSTSSEDDRNGLDFGVWDDDYVCFVPVGSKGIVDKVLLSSRKSDLKKAREWKKRILEKAVKISDPNVDLVSFS